MLVLERVENRGMMPVLAKGRCAMSVSKKFCHAEYENLIAWLAANCGAAVMERVLSWEEVKSWPGSIVCTMDYEAMDALPRDAALAHECRLWNEDYRYWWLLSKNCLCEGVFCRPISLRCRLAYAVCRQHSCFWRHNSLSGRQNASIRRQVVV